MAQLGARLNGIQEVTGSIPVRSTNQVVDSKRLKFRTRTFVEPSSLASVLRIGLAITITYEAAGA